MKQSLFLCLILMVSGCGQVSQKSAAVDTLNAQASGMPDSMSCSSNLPNRYGALPTTAPLDTEGSPVSRAGMKFIPTGTFTMGASDQEGRKDEYPAHQVKVDGFWIDETEVTNAQFATFVKATGYVTQAEQEPDWEELKKQLPPGTPKPAEELLQPASLTFVQPKQQVNINDVSQWWGWTAGASWRHPQGPKSTIKGKDHYPVVQVSWLDAQAYAKWIGKRLPTEAEWEYAARGGLRDKKHPWGDEDPLIGKYKANTWQGEFPYVDKKADGFGNVSPVKSFAPNGYGLYDMAGNVWEWTADWYAEDYYRSLSGVSVNPKGPSTSYDPEEPTVPKKTIRGGSFMCHSSYCKGYRVSSRMKSSLDTGLENTGFRCVTD